MKSLPSCLPVDRWVGGRPPLLTMESSRSRRAPPQRLSLLRNRHVELRDIVPGDYARLYEISLSDAVVDTWQSSSQSISFERFCGSLWDNSLVQFGFGLPDGGGLLGMVKVELANFRHQTAQIAIFSAEEAQRTGLPMMAMASLVNLAMHRYPLRKLYAEVPEFNFEKIASGESKFFAVEGRLVDHEIHFNSMWDTYIIAISRDHWRAVLSPLVDSWRLD